MRVLQKLVRNGNSTQVTIPAVLMKYLDWRPGDYCTLELRANGHIVLRKPRAKDLKRRITPASALSQSPVPQS